jgi:hypothetical protein
MGSRPDGVCALCRGDKPLCDSHLLPKAAYRILKRLSPGQAEPLLMSEDSYCHSTKQLRAHLLCEDCEKRFRTRGETWLMANCYRGPGEFRFKSILEKHGPVAQKYRWVCLFDDKHSGTRNGKVIYFACSVFWRAGALTWRRSHLPIPFRRYTLNPRLIVCKHHSRKRFIPPERARDTTAPVADTWRTVRSKPR